jgi:eukaryotic-like serine/threonine-protein kinase
MIGTMLGPYRVLEKLGAGGMGEVYKARDTRLDRVVAIKILPSHLSSDSAARARFEREARAISHLNDPRICTLHDIGREGETDFLVMEYLEGQTLAARIEKGPLPVADVLRYGREVAHALDRAHRAGIVHRDLKPANVMLVGGGTRQAPATVKLMDFGLARGVEPGGAAPGATQVATMARPVTAEGTIVGTLHYMAPEQLEGRETDSRTDVWALGCVLYEMATGKRAFDADSQASLVAAIMDREPPAITDLQPLSPAALEHVVSRCLAKDPAERWQSARDVAHELEWLTQTSSALPTPPAGPKPLRRRRWLAIAAASTLVAAVGAGLFIAGRASILLPQPPKFTRLTFREGYISNARFTQGGNSVVYSAQWDGREPEIFESQTDGSSTHQWPGLTGFALFSVGSKGDLAVGKRNNAVSIEEYGPLFTASPSGTAPKPGNENIRWAEWMRDGSTLAVVKRIAGKDVLEIPEGKEVGRRTDGQFMDLRLSPDGRRWALTEHPFLNDSRGTVAMVDDAGRMTTLTKEFASVSGVAWSQDGSEIWFSAVEHGVRQRLYAVTTSPKPRLRAVSDLPGSLWLGDLDHSTGRVLLGLRRARAGIRGQLAGDTRERELGWLDYALAADMSDDGKTLLLTDEGESASRSYSVFRRSAEDQRLMRLDDGFACALSPDGQWALAIRLDTPQHLVLLPTGAGKPRDLPPGPVVTFQNAAFLSDGKRILFVGAERDHADRTWIQDVSGGPPSQLTDEGTAGVTVSPKDRFIAAVTHDRRLMFVPLDRSKPTEVGTLGPSEAPCQWSKDGNTLYLSRTAPSLELSTFDVRTRQRRPWKKLEVADPAGVNYWNVVMTRDARFYAYSYCRWLDELYVVDGLK